MKAEALVVIGRGSVRLDRCAKRPNHLVVCAIQFRSGSLQGLANDLRGGKGHAEEGLRGLGDRTLLIVRGPLAGHGG